MRAILISLLVCLTTEGCKSRPASSQKNIINPKSGLTLNDFQYEPGKQVYKELAARVGCQEASQWIAQTKDPLLTLIGKLKQQQNPYGFLADTLFQPSTDCVPSAKKTNLDGIKTLHDMVTAKGFGLTVVVVGGFGSHLTKSGALLVSRELWQANLPPETFNTVRLECRPNSYATDEVCAPIIMHQLDSIMDREDPEKPQLYLLWGYSKGGTTAIEVISRSQRLRDRLLALVTVGAPFGGGVPMHTMIPLIDEMEPYLKSFSQKEKITFTGLMLMGSGSPTNDENLTMVDKISDLFTPSNFPQVRAGMTSLLPSFRKEYLKQEVAGWDLTRTIPHQLTGALTTPIFHVSSAADIGRFRAIPDLMLQADESVAVNMSSFRLIESAELSLINEFARHPLSDTCVALEHSVIPKNNLPKGATTELLALLKVDHMSLGFSDRTAPGIVPSEAFVDSIIDSVSQRLRGAP